MLAAFCESFTFICVFLPEMALIHSARLSILFLFSIYRNLCKTKRVQPIQNRLSVLGIDILNIWQNNYAWEFQLFKPLR